MRRTGTLEIALLALGLAAPAGRSRGSDTPAPPPPPGALDAARRGVALEAIEGELIAIGPRYKARFTGSGFELVPALGRSAKANRSLAFALESVRRGREVFVRPADGGTPPRRSGLTARYERGAGVVESYDVRPEGIEQSFRFDALPPGTGDLVVRGRIATDLPPPGAGESGGPMRFEEAGLGGVAFGEVTGIDGEGGRVKGTLRFDGSHPELALPAAFVDRAPLPILLDPLVGPTLGIALGTSDDERPDVAYDLTNGVYLVVWERHVSLTDSDIYGLRFSSTGGLVGGLLPIEVSPTIHSVHPSVANVNQTDRFLVAWQQIWPAPDLSNIVGRMVSAVDGSLSGSILIAGTTADEKTPDVGGDPRFPFPPLIVFPAHALVVWATTGGAIQGRIVDCPAAGSPTLYGSLLSLSAPGAAEDSVPAVSKSCGSPPRWLVVWERFSTSPIFDNSDILARLVEPDGTVCGTSTANLNMTGGPHESNPDCAGDGTNFVVVYQYRDLLDPLYDDSVHAKPVTHSGTCAPGFATLVVGSGTFVAADPLVEEVEPAIELAGPKYLVVWAQEATTTNYDIVLSALDPATMEICEPATPVGSSAISTDVLPALGAQWSGGVIASGDQALVVWQSTFVGGTNGDILGRRVESIGAGGAVFALGGGCGGGGIPGAGGPVAIGNGSFAFTLMGADPGATGALLNVSPPAAPIACGSCAAIPFFIVLPAAVSSGAASVPVPIPCDPDLLGGTFEVQWTVFPTAASPCPLVAGVSFSGRLSATVGL